MSRIRPLAVGLPVKDDHVLVLPGFDATRGLRFLRAVGGGIEFGETAEQALRREYTEELAVTLGAVELLGVEENIFTYEGSRGHEIAFIFAVECAELGAIPLGVELPILDSDGAARWIPIAEVRSGVRPLFPTGALELLLSRSG